MALRLRGEWCHSGNRSIEQSARENAVARKHHIWKNSLWSAVGKNLLSRRAAQNALYFRN
jgi:hypothetical protein